MVLKYILLCALVLWLGYEWKAYQGREYQDIRIFIYALLMIFFWFWLYGLHYTVEIDSHEIRVIRQFWKWKKETIVRRGEMVAMSNNYSRRFCRSYGVRQYFHQYSWGDDRPTRVVIFKRDSNARPKALIFRGGIKMQEALEKYYSKLLVHSS